MRQVVIAFFVSLCFLSSPLQAEQGAEILKFKTPEAEKQYKALIEELRCLVCQNQNLAGSDAGLAKDLRAKVYEMVEAGQSRAEVVDYMVTRYGDFVLYRPPFKLKTVVLWLGPGVFLLLALWLSIRWVRSKKVTSVDTLTDAQRETVRELLEKQNKG